MSIILPNGARIFPTTLQGFEEIGRKLEAGEPIIITTVVDGVEIDEVLWSPDDPIRWPYPPKVWQRPPTRWQRWWRKATGFLRGRGN